MTPRELELAVLRFERPPRVPFHPGGGRKSTLAAWHAQGLPADVKDYHAHVRQLLGIPAHAAGERLPADLWLESRMIPQFEEKVIERRARSQIVQDWKGNICEISNEYDVSYLRQAIDFVTRRWIKCPVESRADWADMKRRYDAEDPRRLPADAAARGAALRARRGVSRFAVSGPFWQLREWLGAEGVCLLLLDDPGWAEEMARFWEDFVARLLERLFAHHVPDAVQINEDMAFKAKAFIGPAMVRRFLLPCWKRWHATCARAGVPLFEVDSDGYAGELIPLWIEGGLNCNTPLEVAAGNDLPRYRRAYGELMAYRGGVDKRAIAAGGAVLRAEIDRLRPVIEAGGYVPGCDHGIPPDVSWPNFVAYCRLLAHATGWL